MRELLQVVVRKHKKKDLVASIELQLEWNKDQSSDRTLPGPNSVKLSENPTSQKNVARWFSEKQYGIKGVLQGAFQATKYPLPNFDARPVFSIEQALNLEK